MSAYFPGAWVLRGLSASPRIAGFSKSKTALLRENADEGIVEEVLVRWQINRLGGGAPERVGVIEESAI